MTESREIRFRPLEQSDLSLLQRWLNETPVVKEFYAHGKETDYQQVLAKYGPRIRGEQPIRSFLILCDGVEIGYIQTYLWRDYGDLPRAQGLDEESAGLDLFIGHTEYLHRGLGRLVLRSFLEDVIFPDPQVQSCVLLAEIRNEGALRAYEKAGFQSLRVIPDLPDEPDASYLHMIGDGIPAIDLGYPCRYTHHPIETCSLADFDGLLAPVGHGATPGPDARPGPRLTLEGGDAIWNGLHSSLVSRNPSSPWPTCRRRPARRSTTRSGP